MLVFSAQDVAYVSMSSLLVIVRVYKRRKVERGKWKVGEESATLPGVICKEANGRPLQDINDMMSVVNLDQKFLADEA